MLSLLFGRVFNRLIDAHPPPPPPTPSPFLVKIQRIDQMLFFVLVWKTFTGDGDSSTLAVRGLWNSNVIAENISGINIG